MRHLLLICLIAAVCGTPLSAQDLPLIKIGPGLPSPETFDIIQDTTGIIWICSDKGLTRYDGKDFIPVPGPGEVFERGVTDVEMDAEGRLWFHLIGTRFFYLEDGKFLEAHFSKQINRKITSALKNFKIDSRGVFYFINERDYLLLEADTIRVVLSSTPNSIVIDTTSPDFPVFRWDSRDRLASRDVILGEKVVLKDVVINLQPSQVVYGRSRSEIFFSIGQMLYHVREGELINSRKFDSEVIELFDLHFGYLMVNTKSEGLLFLNPDDLSERYRVLGGSPCSTIYWDDDGGMWITTLENGVFYLPSHFRFSKRFLSEKYLFDIEVNDSIVVGLTKDTVYLLDSHHGWQKQGFPASTRIRTMMWQDKLLLAGNQMMVLENGRMDTALIHLFCKSMVGTSQHLFVGRRHDAFRFDPGFKNQRKIRFALGFNAMDLLVVDGLLYIASDHGLLSMDTNFREEATLLIPDLYCTSLAHLDTGANSILVTGTHGKGILLQKGNEERWITEAAGLAGDFVNDVEFDPSGMLWVATSTGVSRIPGEDLWGQPQVSNFVGANGLFEEEVNALRFLNDQVVLGTVRGLEVIDMERNPIQYPEKTIVTTAVRIDNVPRDQFDTVIMEPGNRVLDVVFRAPAYHQLDRIDYQYQLRGLDDIWRDNSTGNVQFVGLPKGNYQLLTRYRRENGKWSSPTVLTGVTVIPRLYEQAWFWVAVAITVLLLVIWFFQNRLIKRKKQHQLQQQINEFQYQALTAQMNPHFIFNSLNSINNFILQNRREESSVFLSSFAQLMRSILDNSREKVIPLKDVVTNLERYLELEKLRLKGKVNYTISAPQDLAGIKIPNMLIQPFVENSIWHGIAPKNETGNVEISISRERNTLTIIVIDDGIGRKASMERKSELKKKRRSAGTYLTHRRFELMSSLYGENIHYQIIDQHHPDGRPAGTRVSIEMPIKT